jgi:hypothetical protein
MCTVGLTLQPGSDPQSFSAFSTLVCMGNFLPGHEDYNKDPVGLAEMARRITNPTSASFSGTAQNGGIALRATDNIGVSEAIQGCDMVSMTLKPFGDNFLSVKWQDTGKAFCAGGEMLLARAH